MCVSSLGMLIHSGLHAPLGIMSLELGADGRLVVWGDAPWLKPMPPSTLLPNGSSSTRSASTISSNGGDSDGNERIELWASPMPNTPTKKKADRGRYVAVFLSAIEHQQDQQQQVFEPASLRVLRLPPSTFSSSSSSTSSSLTSSTALNRRRNNGRPTRGVLPDLSQVGRWFTGGDTSLPHEKEVECSNTEAVYLPGTESNPAGAAAAATDSVEAIGEVISESDWRKSREVWRLDVWPKEAAGIDSSAEANARAYEWPPFLKPWLPL